MPGAHGCQPVGMPGMPDRQGAMFPVQVRSVRIRPGEVTAMPRLIDVLLLFTHGGSNEPVVIRGGVIPAHETRGAGHIAFAISSDALETWRTRLRECEIEIESEVQWERGGASLYFRDPDANLVELATPGVWPNY